MTKYLLLRDNKQSGPYDLDELRTKGLKAYDLVWIDGKSAAWRYPSEVDEMKSFAPAVEEQPFDRFYKRPAQSPQPQANEAGLSRPALPGNDPIFGSAGALSTLNNSASAPTIGEPSAVPGKRIIYVTLPSPPSRESAPRIPASTGLIAVQQADHGRTDLTPGNSFQPHASALTQPPLSSQAQPSFSSQAQPTSPSQAQAPFSSQPLAPSREPGQALSQPLVQPVLATPPVPKPAQEPSKPPPVRFNASYRQGEENISHDPNDMWRSGVEMPPRPAKTSLKKALQSVIVLLCILALLAAGIFIGLSMNRDSFGFSPKFASKDPSVPGPPIQRADHPSSSMPVYTASVPITRDSVAGTEHSSNLPVTSHLNAVAALPAQQKIGRAHV